ncbi:hypothetical protein A3L04_05645 [Thermococcus chitonophagus]|uniref:Uncharacterized protein n=1 Tax=Thermococcus chitonophagus TaxID=54262 RepID=A0A160VRA4_9EURY|nr:hypothetical protein [Thermococcus chitonophagus]ASJ16587.1 hypothetical protein A3L04_05645 [Thermococcus chitonophagus]CUX77493.1 hypothetical protein CHITON_0714 [Thermococcus chitonophagus]
MLKAVLRRLKKKFRSNSIGVIKVEKRIRAKNMEAILGKVEKGVVRVGAIVGKGRVVLIKKHRGEIEFAMSGEEIFVVIKGTVGKIKDGKVEVFGPKRNSIF